MEEKLKLYGTGWCTKSAVLRNYLQSKWIEFEDLNVETNSDADSEVRALYNGVLKFPTVKYGDDFLKNPTIAVLNDFLKKHKIE